MLFEHQGAGLLAKLISDAVADPRNDILSLVFPVITSQIGLRELVAAMLEAGCYMAADMPSNTTLISLRYSLGKAESWIVGFAPIAQMPATRRAPFVELAIRTKRKNGPTHEELNNDESQAHLADVQLGFPEEVVTRLIPCIPAGSTPEACTSRAWPSSPNSRSCIWPGSRRNLRERSGTICTCGRRPSRGQAASCPDRATTTGC